MQDVQCHAFAAAKQHNGQMQIIFVVFPDVEKGSSGAVRIFGIVGIYFQWFTILGTDNFRCFGKTGGFVSVKAAIDLMASAGLDHPDKVNRDMVSTRVERNVVETFAQTFPELDKGCLLHENTVPKAFLYFWKRATTERF